MKVGANSKIGVVHFSWKSVNLTPVEFQEPNAKIALNICIMWGSIPSMNVLSVSDMNVSTSSSWCTQGISDDAKFWSKLGLGVHWGRRF
jgi:hypothetical protein